MNAFTISVVIWGCISAAFVALMIYRGYLAQHESDHLYLSEEAPSADHLENESFIRRDESIQPLLRGVGGAAILMTVVVVVLWFSKMLSVSHLI